MNLYQKNKQTWVSPKSEGTCTDALAADVSLALLHCVLPPQQPPLIIRLTCYIYVFPGTFNHFVLQADKFEQLLLQTGIQRTCGNSESRLLNIQRPVRNLEL